jgi:hypothetical protein
VLDARLLMFILLHDDRMSTRCSAGAATAALRGQRSPHVAAMSRHAEAAPTSLLWLAVAGCARSFHTHQPSSGCYGCFIRFKCFGGVAWTARRLRLVDVAMPQPSLQMSEMLLDWRLQRRLVHYIHWYAGRRKVLRPVLRCERANARRCMRSDPHGAPWGHHGGCGGPMGPHGGRSAEIQ